MTDKEFILTPEGYEKTSKELDELRNVKRKEIIDRIEKAKELGDLSENAEYSQARDEQAFMEGKIAEMEYMLKNAKIVTKDDNKKTVQMGSKIVAETNNNTKEFQIVGVNEVDPIEGKISNESPLGKAMLNKQIDDEIEIETPKGSARYIIKDII